MRTPAPKDIRREIAAHQEAARLLQLELADFNAVCFTLAHVIQRQRQHTSGIVVLWEHARQQTARIYEEIRAEQAEHEQEAERLTRMLSGIQQIKRRDHAKRSA